MDSVRLEIDLRWPARQVHPALLDDRVTALQCLLDFKANADAFQLPYHTQQAAPRPSRSRLAVRA